MSSASPGVAVQYHRLTKYTQENVRRGAPIDWARQPSPTKEIVSGCHVPLRRHLTFLGSGPEEVDGPAQGGAAGLPQLSRLLFHAYGITGLLRYPGGGRQLLRAAPSAGALYPIEIYVVAGRRPGLEAGIYNYQAPTHELVRLWEGDLRGEVARACEGGRELAEAPFLLLLTGVFWRSAWRYRERGYRRVLLDCGHVLANLCAYAPCEELSAASWLAFADGVLNGLMFFEEATEGVLAVVPVLAGRDRVLDAPWRRSPPAPPAALDAAPLAEERELTQSATLALHRASSLPVGAPPAAPAPPSGHRRLSRDAIPLPAPDPASISAGEAIRHRRSARAYSARPVPLPLVGAALGFALGRGGSVPPLQGRRTGWIRAHLAVQGVEGLDPGLYEVGGAGEALIPVARGDPRPALFHASLHQAIARDAACVLVLSGPGPEAVAALGDRAYRYLHLEAGCIGERFQLAATALDLGACGIGGFLDDEVGRLLGLRADDWVLYLITLGAA